MNKYKIVTNSKNHEKLKRKEPYFEVSEENKMNFEIDFCLGTTEEEVKAVTKKILAAANITDDEATFETKEVDIQNILSNVSKSAQSI